MAKKFLVSIDLNQNELQNARIQNLATAPSSPAEGQLYFDSSAGDKSMYFWDGTSWIDMGGDLRSVSAGTGISVSGTRDVTVSLDTSSTRNTDHSGVTLTAGSGLTGGGDITVSRTFNVGAGTGITVNADDVALDYLGTNNFIDSATNLEGTAISTADTIIYHDATDDNVKKGLVSDLPFSNNAGTVTSVAASGSGGVTISGSPITSSGTIAIGLSAVPNSSLANSSITINGTAVSLGGSISVGDITGVTAGTGLEGGGTSGSVTVSLDYAGVDNFIDSATNLEGTAIATGDTIVYHDASDNNVKKGLVSDLPFSNNSGTVTSVAVSGNNGITVSGSPITSSGTITLGLSNLANSVLANSTITVGTTSIALGASATAIAGLTSLDFAAGNRAIGASIGANNLTLGGSTSTVVVAGNLIVSGTTTTIDSNTVNIGDNIIVLNADETGTPSQDGGIEIERGTSANVTLVWDETNDRWTVGSESFVAATFIGALSGNATTATTATSAATWTTARTITLGGDLTGNVSIDGSANVTLTATIAANSVALGTDTTGNYVATASGSNGVSVSGSGSEGAALTISGTSASTTAVGVVELATLTETRALTDTSRAVTAASLAGLRHSETAPSVTGTSHTVSHNMGSTDVIVQVYEISSGATVECDVIRNSTTQVTLQFAQNVTLNTLKVLIIKIA